MKNYKFVKVEDGIINFPLINVEDENFLRFLSSKIVGGIGDYYAEIYDNPEELYRSYDKSVRFWEIDEKGRRGGYTKLDDYTGFLVIDEEHLKVNYYVGFYFWIQQQEILYKGLDLRENYDSIKLYQR